MRKVRDRGAEGKGWSLERAGIEVRKMAFRGGEWGVGNVGMGPSGDKRLIVRRLQKCARMAYLGARRGVMGKTV